jgi:hypothetical protein
MTNCLYYGKAIASGNEIDDKKMKGKNLLLLKDFRKKQSNNYYCGTIYLLRKKIIAKGKIKIISKNVIEVKGSYLLMSSTMLWYTL